MAKSWADSSQKTVTIHEKRYVLSLDEEEMDTLYDVLRRVGGVPSTTRRKYVDSMLEALKTVYSKADVYSSDIEGQIHFNG